MDLMRINQDNVDEEPNADATSFLIFWKTPANCLWEGFTNHSKLKYFQTFACLLHRKYRFHMVQNMWAFLV